MKLDAKFSVSRGVVKMIEALENSPAVRRIVWGIVGCAWSGYLVHTLASTFGH